ncbi:MAG TPA: CAP domain-containing protein [Maritimibacter sp.]|nr:CAP domain-containing protein [Maritimibacter sp.]
MRHPARSLRAALVAAGLALAAAPAAVACEVPGNAARLMADAGVAINTERRSAGRKALTRNAALDQAAQRHACWMGVQGEFSHQGVSGSRPSDRIAATGYRARVTSENIAAGQTGAKQVVAEWMASPGHRTNILRTSVTDYGIGVSMLNGRPLWVMLFAAKM